MIVGQDVAGKHILPKRQEQIDSAVPFGALSLPASDTQEEPKMNPNTAQRAAAPSPAESFSATLTSAFTTIQEFWQDHQCRANHARAMATFADIDTHTL